MRERNAQIVLLVRAFEEVDRQGRVLPARWVEAATHRARLVTVGRRTGGRFARPGEETLVRRARHVFRALWSTVPHVHRVMELARLRSLLAPSLVGGAFLAGLGLALLDRRPGVDMVSLPLLSLLGWNLVVYATLATVRLVRPMLRRLRPARDIARRHPLAAGLAVWVMRAALWRSRVGWSRAARGTDVKRAVSARSFVRFCALWQRSAGPLLVMRVRATLHLASISLVCGTLLGMWLSAVALGHGGYASSGLDASLAVLFEPAGLLTGIDFASLPRSSAAFGTRGAADWLGLWTMTALLFVGLPRGVLVVYTVWRAARMATVIPLDFDEPYFRRVLSVHAG